mmetsp:Transcript_17991/g.27265  ORF Transcript_17991/g.27265 Transcript_17991/m.27265 type:complete len:142 (+) Transcript_17991:1548-1973(+)
MIAKHWTVVQSHNNIETGLILFMRNDRCLCMGKETCNFLSVIIINTNINVLLPINVLHRENLINFWTLLQVQFHHKNQGACSTRRPGVNSAVFVVIISAGASPTSLTRQSNRTCRMGWPSTARTQSLSASFSSQYSSDKSS